MSKKKRRGEVPSRAERDEILRIGKLPVLSEKQKGDFNEIFTAGGERIDPPSRAPAPKPYEGEA